MRGDRALILAACLTTLFATTVLAALTGYTGSVTREGLRRTLAQADFETIGTRIAAPVPGGGFAAAERSVAGSVRAVYRDLPVAVSVSARSDSYTLPGQERRRRPLLTAFAAFSGIERHARPVAGRWPSQSAAGGVVEAALPVQAARALKLGVGDTLTLRGRIDRSSTTRVTVTGLFAVERADDYFWQGDRLVTSGVERLDYTTFGPFVVPPEVFASRFTATGAYARWTVLPDLRRIEAGELSETGRRATKMAAELRGRYTVVTALPELADQLDGALRVARSTMLIPVLQLIVLAGYALMLVARLLAEHRRSQVALLRARGASMRQLAWLTAGEGLLLALPGAVLAPLLAGPLLRLAGHAPAVRASGLRLDAGPPAPLWTVSIGAAVVCALVLTLPTLRGAALTYVETQTGRGRSGRRGLAQRSGADLALLAVAALGVWQLTRYDGPVSEGKAIDPFIVTGPALALLAGGLLLLRAVPVVSRVTERLTARSRGFALALGARQVGRRPLRYTGPALLLVMATAVGVLSVSTMATWRRSQVDQADFQAGADLRIGSAQHERGPRPLGQGGRFAALPGVTMAGPLVRREASTGAQNVTMLAGDAVGLGRMLGSRADGIPLGALTGARSRPVLATVPGRPGKITFDLRLTPRNGWTPGADARNFGVGVTIADGRGLTYRAELTGLVPDGKARTHTVTAADLAGPAGRLTFPLSIRGFHYSYGGNPSNERMELGVLRIRGDGDAGVAAPAEGSWDLFVDSGQPRKEQPRFIAKPGALLTLTVPPTHLGEFEWLYDASGDSVHAVLVEPKARAVHRTARGGRVVHQAVPGIVTTELASRARIRVGATLTLGTAEGDQPITVAGIVAALPSTSADRPAVLVDLPTLTERRLAAGAAEDRPTEWWLAVRGDRTAPAARELAAHPDLNGPVVDRAALRRQLRDAPLGGALQGALILGFLAALAFAVIGFAVNAAVAARERAGEFAVLRALGVRSRQLSGVLAVEQAFLVVLGLAGGTLLGLAVAKLVIPDIVLTVRAATPYPPVDLVVDWPPIAAMLAGVVAVLGIILLLLGRVLRRRRPGEELRMGEQA